MGNNRLDRAHPEPRRGAQKLAGGVSRRMGAPLPISAPKGRQSAPYCSSVAPPGLLFVNSCRPGAYAPAKAAPGRDRKRDTQKDLTRKGRLANLGHNGTHGTRRMKNAAWSAAGAGASSSLWSKRPNLGG
jgi:hypothetical protein